MSMILVLHGFQIYGVNILLEAWKWSVKTQVRYLIIWMSFNYCMLCHLHSDVTDETVTAAHNEWDLQIPQLLGKRD